MKSTPVSRVPWRVTAVVCGLMAAFLLPSCGKHSEAKARVAAALNRQNEVKLEIARLTGERDQLLSDMHPLVGRYSLNIIAVEEMEATDLEAEVAAMEKLLGESRANVESAKAEVQKFTTEHLQP